MSSPSSLYPKRKHRKRCALLLVLLSCNDNEQPEDVSMGEALGREYDTSLIFKHLYVNNPAVR